MLCEIIRDLWVFSGKMVFRLCKIFVQEMNNGLEAWNWQAKDNKIMGCSERERWRFWVPEREDEEMKEEEDEN